MSVIIADACANHLGDRRLIENMIYKASDAGVDIIKFQSFQAKLLNHNWKNREKWYKYYKSVELSDEDHEFILNICEKAKINPLFTVFDTERVDLLHKLGIKTIKISSADGYNNDLIYKCGSIFDQVIISTGMIDSCRIKELKDFTLFYCISKYPAEKEDIDFERMKLFDGFSSHCPDLSVTRKAIEMGMKYIEHHFTLGRDLPGKDHSISLLANDFKKIIEYRNYLESCELYKTRWR